LDFGSYTLQVSLGAPDDHGNSSGTATPVGVPSNTVGMIGVTGDEDWFSFTAQTGVNYVFETVLGTLGDSVLWLYGSDGVTELDFNDDNVNLESRIEWIAPSNGTFYLAVGGFGSDGGTYQLIVDLMSGAGVWEDSPSDSGSFPDETNAPTEDFNSNRISPSWSLARQEHFRISSTQPDSRQLSSLRPRIDDFAVPIEWANIERIDREERPLAHVASESRKKSVDSAFESWDSNAEDISFGWLAPGV
jgi:hypothetical protein